MKTLQEEIDNATQKHVDEVAHLARKHAVLALLPIGEYAPPFVHSYSLYGAVGSLSFSVQRYASIAAGKSPDTALLRTLLTQFPPVPVLKRKDACTSFIPEPESYTNNGEYSEVEPVLVDIDPNQYSQSIKVRWYATLPTGDLWKFEVEFPLHIQHKLGRLALTYNYAFGREGGDIISVAHCDFTPSGTAKRVRWASGDRKTPNHFTLYWDRGQAPDVPALLEA